MLSNFHFHLAFVTFYFS